MWQNDTFMVVSRQHPTHAAEVQMVGSLGLDPPGLQQPSPVDRQPKKSACHCALAPKCSRGIQNRPYNSYTGFCLCLSGWREQLACWKDGCVLSLYGCVCGALCA